MSMKSTRFAFAELSYSGRWLVKQTVIAFRRVAGEVACHLVLSVERLAAAACEAAHRVPHFQVLHVAVVY